MKKRSDAAARWHDILRKQRASGLSVAAFCRRSRISQPSFYVWRRRLREAGTLTGVRASDTFAEVCVSPESTRVEGILESRWPHQDGVLELVLLGGRRIMVRAGFDRTTLLALIDAVEQGAPQENKAEVGAPVPARRESGV